MTRPLIVGGRLVAAASASFADALRAGDDAAALRWARRQVEAGAAVLDLGVDLPGRDAAADLARLLPLLHAATPAPLMLDSARLDVLRAGLALADGPLWLNSIHLADGLTPPLDALLRAARERAARVVGLTLASARPDAPAAAKIDEAERLVDLLCGRYGFAAADVLIDLAMLPAATARPAVRATLAALARWRDAHPDVGTLLGIHNGSYLLPRAWRPVVDHALVTLATEHGLSAAHVDPLTLPASVDPAAARTARRWLLGELDELGAPAAVPSSAPPRGM